MTREALAITPSYPINGVGPYPYNNPYTQGALRAFVEIDERLIPLESDEYLTDPLNSNTLGNIVLTGPSATTYDGGTLYILRQTDIEQGFAGQSARENGLSAQLDWMTEAIQDTSREVKRALRSTGEIAPGILKAGRAIFLDEDLKLVPGPSADEIENAQTFSQIALEKSEAAKRSAAEAAQYTFKKFANYDDVVASALVFNDGDFVVTAFGFVMLRAVAADGKVTNAAGQEFVVETGPRMDQRSAETLTELAKYPDGTLGYIAGVDYVSLSTAVGAASAGNNVGVDGVAYLSLALERLSARNLPIGPIEMPATFDNKLGVSIYYDGAQIQYDVLPFDIVDFRNSSSVAVNQYYVDWDNGNDANDGLTPATAWKNASKASASAVAPAVINLMDEWLGITSVGTSFNYDGNILFQSIHASGHTDLTNMVKAYDVNTWNWVDEGGGVWSTSEATTTATIFSRLGTACLDAKYKDIKGGASVVPDVGSLAACQAKKGTQFHDAANKKKYVHLRDGRIPDPATGWRYSHPQGGANFQQNAAVGGVMLFQDIHDYRNAYNAGSAAFRYRNANSTSANTGMVGFRRCLSYASAGNGFEIFDAWVSVFEDCHTRFSRKDGFNNSSFVSLGTKGEYQTSYAHNCSSFQNGFSDFALQLAPTGSDNGFTTHNSMHAMRTNCIAGDCKGAVFADVNGVHSINYVCQGSKPGGDWPFVFWHEKYLGVGTTEWMLLWGCAANDDGDPSVALISNTPQAGGAVNNGDVRVKWWRGQTDGKVIGQLYDADGIAA